MGMPVQKWLSEHSLMESVVAASPPIKGMVEELQDADREPAGLTGSSRNRYYRDSECCATHFPHEMSTRES